MEEEKLYSTRQNQENWYIKNFSPKFVNNKQWLKVK